MRQLCVFITHKFPFQTDETFIENEIMYLSASFDTILIIAAYANLDDPQTRKVPENVIVTRLGYSSLSALQKVKLGLSGLFFGDKEVFSEMSRVPAFGWKVNCLYVSGLKRSMENAARTILSQSVDLHAYSSCLIYSYWFSEHALLANSLKSCCGAILPTTAISRAHRYDVYAYRKRYKAFPFKEKMIREIDAVYPCSEDGSSYLATCFPSYASKIHTAYLGTIDHGLNPIQDEGPFTIVSCSNIVPVKQVHLIAEALFEVKKRGFSSFLWICIGDGPLLGELKESVCERLDLASQVSFLGRIPNNEVLGLYRKQHVDVFVNVSESEGLPVSLMEAQSFGIPCIATDVGGTSEIVSREVGVLLPEKVSVEILADQIIGYMQNRATILPAVREHARKNWLAKFNAETNYRKWVQILRSLQVD